MLKTYICERCPFLAFGAIAAFDRGLLSTSDPGVQEIVEKSGSFASGIIRIAAEGETPERPVSNTRRGMVSTRPFTPPPPLVPNPLFDKPADAPSVPQEPTSAPDAVPVPNPVDPPPSTPPPATARAIPTRTEVARMNKDDLQAAVKAYDVLVDINAPNTELRAAIATRLFGE